MSRHAKRWVRKRVLRGVCKGMGKGVGRTRSDKEQRGNISIQNLRFATNFYIYELEYYQCLSSKDGMDSL